MTYIRSAERKIQIYGITGKKGSGKDSFAQYVCEYNSNFSIIRFADDLKSMVRDIWWIPLEDMESQEAKAKPFNSPIDMDAYLPRMVSSTGLNLVKLGIKATSLRELLQYFGTEYVRGICDNYWVNRCMDKAKRIGNKVLITDCRFENEAVAIRSAGGKIIRISRLDASTSLDGHASEILMEKIIPDLTIGTLTGKFSLQRRISYLIALNKDQAISRFDYPKVKNVLDMYSSGKSIRECSELLGLHGKESKAIDCILDYYGLEKRGGWRKPHSLVGGKECKQCSICKEWLCLDKFGLSMRSIDMLQPHCESCKKSSESYKSYSQVNTLPKIYFNTRKNAAARGLEFDINLYDMEELFLSQDKKCFYSGKPLCTEPRSPNKLTLDRIDSSKGYIRGNIVLCCYTANIMKNKMDTKTFYEWIEAIHETTGRHKCKDSTML